MTNLPKYLDEQLGRGRSYFSKEEAQKSVGLSSAAHNMATNRLIKNKRLVSPWRGFYLILRPEDKILGAPEPVRLSQLS